MMRDLHLSLLEYLEQLETEKDRIEEIIIEVRRRIATIEEVIGCSVLGAKALVPPMEDEFLNADAMAVSVGV